MRRIVAVIAVAAPLALDAPSLAAQCAPRTTTAPAASCVLTYRADEAMVSTPAGAVAPIPSRAMLALPGTAVVGVRYGRMADRDWRNDNVAGSLELPVGARASASLIAGYVNPSCSGCDGQWMVGGGVEGRLASMSLGVDRDDPALTVGLGGEVGYGASAGHFATAALGLPVAFVASTASVKIAPFVKPGVGYAHSSGEGWSEGHTSFLLGGGVAFLRPAGSIGASVGFQRVFIRNAQTVLGVGLVLSPGM